MRAPSRLAPWRLALFCAGAGAGALAACVEIQTEPGGVAAIRLTPVPPSIVIGDVLRDSVGNELRLRAVAFSAGGDTVGEAPFRFVYVPLTNDTALRDNRALVVDSVTGAVRAAPPPFVVPRGRVGVRLGDRLQVLDTVEIVPRPTRLARADTADLRLVFDCRELPAAPLTRTALSAEAARNAGVTGTLGNHLTLATRLTGDSTPRDTARPIRSYLVRYEIVSPAPGAIRAVELERGGRRQAIAVVDGAADTPLRYDTTDASGVAGPRLRIFPAGLTRAAFPDTVIPVTVRATAIRSARDTVPGPVDFVVQLRRLTRSPLDGSPLACP